MPTFLIILLILLIIYKRYINIYTKGINIPAKISSPRKYTASIIVAAHNEEGNISNLLTALVNQSYPTELMEIIIANDSSTDRTRDIVLSFQKRWPVIKLIDVVGRDTVQSPKKNALQQAIDKSCGEIILTTDADCIVGQYWVESMISNYEEDIDMVVGFSQTSIINWKKSSLVQKFEFFDFVVMYGVVAGAIAQGKYFSCIGQNLSYRKSTFYKVGGFERIKKYLSGDDINLLQLFRKEDAKVAFSFNRYSFARTRAASSWIQLFNQRSRWASNMKLQLKLNPEFFLYLLSVICLTSMIFITLFLDYKVGLLFIGTKAFFEYRFINKVFNKFKIDNNRLNFFPLWIILQPIFGIIVSLMGQVNMFKWKGKKQKYLIKK